MSDTPETQEAVERWQQGKINIFDEMARLERERNDMRSCVESLVEVIVAAIKSGDWKVDGACDPDMALKRAMYLLK